MNTSPEVDRETVAALVRGRVRDMIEKAVPGSTGTDEGRAVLHRLEQSPGFQEFVTLQVAELEARLKGQLH
ncbi:hypothetical protein J2X90_005582 [Variovorax paradoxus]|uniref:hypothetical protein n=1 Tax=Variovorax paradoxus TaxID=34073 RepID=UPI00278B1ECD|nr:hypothetical protein [Variovorax paradoxus]MDQ0027746.1 hypothetical protein [Variovorax paradoxus]